mmetsp:Transcript_155892/g.378625  ORF Transcript_155892/g.378625 Transcript_155892/m.378625 type:complete len:92 (+) Transcript_155892:2-277(+)
MQLVTRIFLKRKVWKKDVRTAVKKQSTWRSALITEFIKASGSRTAAELDEARAEAEHWFHDHVVPVFPSVRHSSVAGVQGAMAAAVVEHGW